MAADNERRTVHVAYHQLANGWVAATSEEIRDLYAADATREHLDDIVEEAIENALPRPNEKWTWKIVAKHIGNTVSSFDVVLRGPRGQGSYA